MRPILSTFHTCLTGLLKPRTPLAKAIVLVLLVKLIGIASMKLFMFPDNSKPAVNAIAMAHAIGLSPP